MSSNELSKLGEEIHQWARSNGFYEPDKVREFDGQMMLVVSEAVEALEEWRNGRHPQEIYRGESGKPEGIPIELADILIRVLDICAHHRIGIDYAVRTKMDYNKTRPYRNGGKRS